ncbi:pyridoxal phosphate-dependent decarboxylase family protein [Nannocystis punicea]|uniref:Pyridoxal-dependent decarboxylase n=1 Tax=Nannocystis punicea TaxID=2995304 RepID=A0ABY7H2H4_9BACT|nr:pyridoxal-dependent decarboxylase [Nannocystis poenicansa]WAS93450.1 pyridoxal-dependent decarboxylase [Nannocystis poenicansa]
MDLDELVRPILELLRGADARDVRISDLAGPDAHAEAFTALGASLSLGPGDAPLDLAALTRAIEAVIARSVRTLHPRFFNQNFAGADPIAVVGDFLGAALNTTMATYEAAPVFTLMERAVLARLAALAGWGAHDGVFVPGGSFSNLYALQLARLRLDPDARERGHDGAPLVAFASTHAHYSLEKSVVLLGLGRRALVEVDCDERGQLRPDALAAAIDLALARGQRPFFVGATAGTTVLGGFDPLPALADLAKRHGLWLHVDGSFGASALFSPAQSHLMAGVERADSLAWNLHKMLGVTQQCAAFLVQKPGSLRAAFATGASYLFQPDKPYAELDSGDATFQCARRVDALKAWLTWKARGEAGFAARIDHAVALADHCAARIAGDPRFCLAAPPSWVNVCFWWIPPTLRPFAGRTPETDAALHALAPRIKAALLRRGEAMLAFQPIDGGPNCFRLLFINPATQIEDVDATLELLDACGREALA